MTDDLNSPAARLAEALKAARASRDMTQSQLAAASGVSLATIQAIEAARGGEPRPSTARRLEASLGWGQGATRAIRDGSDAPVPRTERGMDLRHLALILNEGWQAAEAEGDVPLSRALAAMAETAVHLHLNPDGVERDFAVLAERLS